MIKIIHDHPNYAVSDQGRVYRIRNGEFKELKPDLYGKYPVVKLDRKNCYVHRLVAEAFVHATCRDDNVVVHLDNDTMNNNASNLIWTNQSTLQTCRDYLLEHRKEKLLNS